MLHITNLSKSFNKIGTDAEIKILNSVELNLAEAETLSIMGKSGSGKSTLLSIIAGLDEDYSGEVFFDNQNLKKISKDKQALLRAENIGMIFQQYHLMEHLTALENVMLPLEILGIADAAAKSKALLHKVGLEHRVNHFPYQLSGGEKQRVAIARAIVNKRRMVLADEPTGNLDEKNGALISTLFFELVEAYKTSLIIVTHSLEIAKMAQRAYEIKNQNLYPLN